MKHQIKTFFYFTLALFFCWFWFRLIDWPQLVSFLEKANLIFLIPILLLMIGNSLLSSWRFKILMQPVGKASVFYFWRINLIGSLTSLIIPFRAGAFLRTYLFKNKFASSFSTCFAISFLDSLIVLFPLVLFSPIFFLPGLILFGLFWFFGRSQTFRRLILSLIKKSPLGKDLKKRGLRLLVNFKKSFVMVSKKREILVLPFFLSILGYFLKALGMYLFFWMLGARVEFFSLLMALATFSLSNLIPGLPVKIGQYELFGLLIFTFFIPVDKNLVAAVLLLSHFIGITFVLAAGFLSILSLRFNKMPIKLSSLKKI
ncbi:flippase-like domain-containing protein [Patescibacteria group bacterium]